MAKKKFYALRRYVDKTDGNAKTGYIRCEGWDVPNNLNIDGWLFDLGVYKHTKEGDWEHDFQPVDVWYVIDCSCGIAIGEGETKKKAIDNAFARLETVDMTYYRKKVNEALEQYGNPPGRGISYL